MSVKREIFAAIKARITGQMPAVKTVRLYNSQPLNEDKEKAYPSPAVFVKFDSIVWAPLANGLQQGETVLKFYVQYNSLKTEDEAIIDLVEELHAYIQNFEVPELLQPLARLSERQDDNHGAVQIWEVDYAAIITDNSGNKKRHLIRMEKIDTLEIERDGASPHLLPQ